MKKFPNGVKEIEMGCSDLSETIVNKLAIINEKSIDYAKKFPTYAKDIELWAKKNYKKGIIRLTGEDVNYIRESFPFINFPDYLRIKIPNFLKMS